MRKTTFIFAGIISAVIGTAFAAGENTVTSKSYVDTQDALKQNKITSKTSGNVVTYNGTDANGQTQFDERGIFDYATGAEYDENTGDFIGIAEGHEGDLMTAGDYWADINSLNGNVNDLSNDVHDINLNVNNVNNQITNINNQLNAQPLTPVTVQLPLTCANRRDGCTLWQIGGTDVVHKLTSCTTATVATDCPACGTGTVAACVNQVCKCNACNGYNISASSASQCCSGYLISGNKCGCSTSSECTAWFDSQGMGIPNGKVAVCTNDHTCTVSVAGNGGR